ncbi:flagellar basal body P-ring formation chaperone FlgA [Legionella waltersii]|uniref:Flagella basal body P-ring formation protein FlgA n=1 Tax=Legionella waltersii TaxID=66969 RepID=A0A0W1ANS2_9GAMM|nr:flagellar basal body P-ring formation chaperone FlgA [Legionella waltersii]KTD82898.1 flagellar basal body P-ring biosynthesis protein FlgA [Legionella waltersii]SNV02188.1 flagella basal body P-ring formation protein FlgA [Legionella waltersii]
MNKCILSLFLVFANTSLFAENVQSLDLLKSKIEQHVLNELANQTEGKILVKADNLDPRLSLKSCPENKLEVFNPYQTPMLNTNTMGIKCMEANSHWTLYVPVKITVLKTVLVAKNALVKGTKIGPDDIYQAELDVQKLKQGYFTNSNDLIGLICKHDISPNNPLTPFNIELAKLVNRGEQVSIIASNDNLSISMDGIAMNDGAIGETIKVKNLSSKRVVDAQVSGRKQVKVVF